MSCGAGQAAEAAVINETDEEIAEEGADAGNETEEEKTEQAVENLRNSEAADLKAVEALKEKLEAVACAPAAKLKMNPE